MKQNASKVLMVRPAHFGFNEQTAGNNYFQQATDQSTVNEQAIKEFDAYVELLRSNGIEVVFVQDTETPHTPDSIFPNNWFSTHASGELVLYPMFAENRRQERKPAVLEYLNNTYKPYQTFDLSEWESKNLFLEGTGSLILDHKAKIAYACRSPRTSDEVLRDFCNKMGFTALIFDSVDGKGNPIYHTNVMLTIADKYIVICADSIKNDNERKAVLDSFIRNGKEIIEISHEQVNNFAGNMMELVNKDGESLLIMSARAKDSLKSEQIENITKYSRIVAPDLEIIETNGGGSARCMIAEIFDRK